MEHWKNLSLENLTEEFEGIVYIEEWKPVVGYEKRYHVSSFGRIKSLKYMRMDKHRILKQGLSCGYPRVDLIYKTNHQLVHRLVALAFIPNPENKPEVNHKLGVTTDNRVFQLEWATKSEQQIHAQKVLGFRPKLPPVLSGKDSPIAKAVYKIDKNTGAILKRYDTIREAELETGINNSTITAAAKGRYHTGGGFKWQYA